MHEMPDDWQQRMAELLEEWEKTWSSDRVSDLPEPFVSARSSDNRFTKWPEWILNYRHPNKKWINKIRDKS